MGGFDGGRDEETYEVHSSNHGGYIGIVDSMEKYAALVEWAVEAFKTTHFKHFHKELELPGVLEYEITEELGKWLFYHPEHFSDSEIPMAFEIEILRRLAQWFYPNAAIAVQPVAEATQPESTTMTVEQLIRALQALDNPSLPVLTRGSAPQKMVDAIEVRVVETAKRTAVFIGKPKAEVEG